MESEFRLSAEDARDLMRIGSGPDDTAYYADQPGADWDNLKRLQSLGLAATANESDWWITPAGREALDARALQGGCDAN